MTQKSKPTFKRIKFIDIIKEVNKELEDLYGLEVVADVLQTTRKVLLKHILYTPNLSMDIFNIADLKIYEKKLTHPFLLQKGASDTYIKFDIKVREYVKQFVKKKIIGSNTPSDIEDIFKSGSISLDDDSIEMDFL